MTNKSPTPLPLLEVSDAMVAAGLDELRDHTLGGDLAYLVYSIYVAMEYERLDAVRALRPVTEGAT